METQAVADKAPCPVVHMPLAVDFTATERLSRRALWPRTPVAACASVGASAAAVRSGVAVVMRT